MIRAPWAERWAGGKPYRSYDRITVGVRDLLSNLVNEALGLMCLRLTRAILAGAPHPQPNVLEGIDTPFHHPSNPKEPQ